MDIITNRGNKNTVLEKEYNKKFDNILKSYNTRDDLINLIINSSDIDIDEVKKANEHINSLTWNSIKLEIFLEPYSTPRPRMNMNTNTVYVKGAREHKVVMKHMISEFNIIYTSTKILIRTFERTPTTGIKPYEILLAEMGKIRPHTNKDWDNVGKTYSDMIQGIILLNDNLIIDAHIEKYYSILPRVEIIIQYQSDFDSELNERRMKNSKLFKDLPSNMKIITNPNEGLVDKEVRLGMDTKKEIYEYLEKKYQNSFIGNKMVVEGVKYEDVYSDLTSRFSSYDINSNFDIYPMDNMIIFSLR